MCENARVPATQNELEITVKEQTEIKIRCHGAVQTAPHGSTEAASA